jgi:hypothetical protein
VTAEGVVIAKLRCRRPGDLSPEVSLGSTAGASANAVHLGCQGSGAGVMAEPERSEQRVNSACCRRT